MLTLLQAAGLNKWLAYGAVAASVLATLGVVYLRIRASGAQSERLDQAEKNLQRIRNDAKERAKIESITTAAARERLRDRWSSR